MSQDEGLLKYTGKVKMADGKLSSEYVDWFKNDDDAVAGYVEIMEELGYEVRSVNITNRYAIVELKPG